MKIVRIIARLNVGGPARHVVWLSSGMRTECQTVLVAGSVPAGEEDMTYFARDHGVDPLFLSEMSREISFRDAVAVWKLFRLLRRECPDVVHTHTAKAGTVGRLAGLLYCCFSWSTFWTRRRPCRFVHTYHGHIFHGYYGHLKTVVFLTVERLLARLITDRIVVVSEQQRREIQETFRVGRPDQFSVIPLGLDLRLFADWSERGEKFREELAIARDEILVGIVGRLTDIKNHRLFLNVVARFKEMNQERRRVRFVIIGDGGLRSNLEQQVNELGLWQDVIFAGSRKDPQDFYPALDIVALSSKNEGTPLTLIEAMANQRPVISTAVGGVVDLLGDAAVRREHLPYVVCQRGISVPPNQAEAFAAGLVRLVDDHRFRDEIAVNGLHYVNRVHSKERLLDNMQLLYSELIHEDRGPVKGRIQDPTLQSRV